jgi:5-methylthioribose kinase
MLNIEDSGALRAYLRRQGKIGFDECPVIEIVAGGVSNRTVRVRRPGGEIWILKQALSQLRVAVRWLSDPSRSRREALAIRWIAQLAPGATPALLFEDPDEHLLAMESVPEPHENWKTMLMAGRLDPALVRQFGRLAATIHLRSWERSDELAPIFGDRSFFESLRIEPYYVYAAEQTPEAAPFLTALVAETRACRLALVHGDLSPKNILVTGNATRNAAGSATRKASGNAAGEVTGNADRIATGDATRADSADLTTGGARLWLVDHEVAHFGDPSFDLGFALAHLLSKAHHLAIHRAGFQRAAVGFWLAYRDAIGPLPWAGQIEARAVRQALGCLLARVAGRSPLEYLDSDERARQRAIVLQLMAAPPPTVAALAQRFCGMLPTR